MSLSDGFAEMPEQSTVAIIAHHPQAVYFGMKSGFIPKRKAPDEIIKGTDKDPSRAGAPAYPCGCWRSTAAGSAA